MLQVSHETARPSAEVDLFGTRPSTDIEFQFRQWDLLLDASTSVAGREEGEDDARSACPLIPWATHIIQSQLQRAATG